MKQEDVHVPAINMGKLKKTDTLKEKMMHMKEKRRINTLLGLVDYVSAVLWVLQSHFRATIGILSRV